MSPRLCHCLALLLVTSIACGPDTDDSASDASGTASTGDASATSEPTGTSTVGASATSEPTGTSAGADECGPAPTPAACAPDESSDPRVAVCAMRDEAGCPGPLDEAGFECRWIATASFAHDALTCEAAKTRGACLAVQNYGDGCSGGVCGSDGIAGDFYYRTDADCQTAVTLDRLCGYSVIGWHTCAWENRRTETCALPHPTIGPELCNCAC